MGIVAASTFRAWQPVWHSTPYALLTRLIVVGEHAAEALAVRHSGAVAAAHERVVLQRRRRLFKPVQPAAVPLYRRRGAAVHVAVGVPVGMPVGMPIGVPIGVAVCIAVGGTRAACRDPPRLINACSVLQTSYARQSCQRIMPEDRQGADINSALSSGGA